MVVVSKQQVAQEPEGTKAKWAGGPFRAAQRHFRFPIEQNHEVSRLYNIEKMNDTELYNTFLRVGKAATERNQQYGITGETAFGATHRTATAQQYRRSAQSRLKALQGTDTDRAHQMTQLLEDANATGLDIKNVLDLARTLDTAMKKTQQDYM